MTNHAAPAFLHADCPAVRAARRPVGSLVASALTRGVEALFAWQERAHQRFHLRQFDDRALRDIGLSRADVEAEAGKPFWMG
ncbi:MAG: DUF1127 domain-containing protein [Dongiaceae bacterium]